MEAISCRLDLTNAQGISQQDLEDKGKTVADDNHKTGCYLRKLQRQESAICNQQVSKMQVGKRRYSFGGQEHKHFKRRRRLNEDRVSILPTKFLLGGNINDPLNLESLADEEVNKKVNEVTPVSSPIPTPKHRTQVQVLIPQNINDPLNLNSGEDIEFNLVSPKSKKRRRSRHKKYSKDISAVVEEVEATATDIQEAVETMPPSASGKGEERTLDKIVSPVLPQRSPVKHNRRFQSKSCDQEKSAVMQLKGQNRKCRFKGKDQKQQKDTVFRSKDAAYQYGNYDRYYGYRNHQVDDPRLRCMKRSWFENKDVLDVGCNVGHFTLGIARDFCPRKIIGLDIDEKLVRVARKNVRHYMTAELLGATEFPISMALCHGPIAATTLPGAESGVPKFPNNVIFVQGNYILESDELLETQRQEFDAVLCLSLTKWVHLNWGDAGVKRLFQRAYAQLRPGGRMILEAQPWASYKRKKKVTETTYCNYSGIKFKPEQFNEYLLSKDVGFSTCELIDTPPHPSKGFRRPIYLFTKGEGTPTRQDEASELRQRNLPATETVLACSEENIITTT